ncbi:hypothetical protein [Enterobacter asburiae]|uniref:hypothetical protein n=1 Tax=Enterobacter asburiae TaxID=61645 RepID=UPI00192B46DD|nr:hypothetical protein [Enterobacter asburiae]MBL5838369.1 hypothetical protein [Enterobacter asburiae]MBL5938989.1 hypothetical protein [Enterobacter asburiae]MBL5961143.1 hypothetical protein [Enterobacter asburiae]MBL5969549.1 hypothetical protein [Enterobacter asburiae]
MSKLIISMLNTLLCVFVIALCLICLGISDNWKECTLAIIIILGGTHLTCVLLSRVLPHKLSILEGILELLGGPLLVIGAIVCFDVFEPWPLKVIGMFVWVALVFFGPSIISPKR